MDDENARSGHERNAEYLRGNPGFAELPSRFRELVLKSPHASSDFASFYANGGRIVGDRNEALASYRSEPRREIRVNKAQLEFAGTPGGSHLVDGMFSTIAHEIGHDKDRGAGFLRGTADEYVQFRSEKEAKAIFNAFPIFNDLARSEPSFKPVWKDLGYSPMGLAWPPLYNQWRAGKLDEQGVVEEMAKSVADFPYTRQDGLPDHSGDGHLTQRDLYLRDYQRLLPKQSEQDHGSKSGQTPTHPLLDGLESKVRGALRQEGLAMTDKEVGNLAASLAAQSARAGMTSVDHVVAGLPVDGSGRRNLFAVQGELNFPGHHRSHVDLTEAAATSMQNSLLALTALESQSVASKISQQSDVQHIPYTRG